MRAILVILCSLFFSHIVAKSYDNPDTIVVARDGTGEFRTVSEALEVCRAFMDYHKVIYIKKGTYKEKVIIPQWLQNIELCGEDRDATIITYDDHANVVFPPTGKGMTTFRTYTLKVEANDITLRNLTIENNAARLGQAVALHTEGDRLLFVNCRFLGNQDTVYTGMPRTRMLFHDCYIEGTTDFIFGPATAWFEHCTIHSKVNSYITAASTPKDVDYGYTLFMNCELPGVICPEGWHHWEQHREQTARYFEYNNRGEGANPANRVGWSRQLTKKEAQQITLERVFQISSSWLLKH